MSVHDPARIDPLQAKGDGRAMRTHYNHLAGGEVGRIAALSDGIFAIAATMLVLDFHTPEPADIHSEAELLRALMSRRRGSCRGFSAC